MPFLQKSISVLSQSHNCLPSQSLFRAATTIPSMVAAWLHYWDGLLHEVPSQVIDALDEYYIPNKAEINAAGLYYNEQPPLSAPRNRARVLVGNGTSPLDLHGHFRAYLIGNRPVNAYDSTHLFLSSPEALALLYDATHATLEAGTVHAHDRSMVIGAGTIHSYDAATIRISSGHAYSHGHRHITAYNTAIIHAPSPRALTLYDNAQLLPALS